MITYMHIIELQRCNFEDGISQNSTSLFELKHAFLVECMKNKNRVLDI